MENDDSKKIPFLYIFFAGGHLNSISIHLKKNLERLFLSIEDPSVGRRNWDKDVPREKKWHWREVPRRNAPFTMTAIGGDKTEEGEEEGMCAADPDEKQRDAIKCLLSN